MRVKVLRRNDDTSVLLVYPGTLDEYGRVVGTLARRAGGEPAAGRAGHASFVVTSAGQRHRWELPDLAASGEAPVMDEPQAIGLLHGEAFMPVDPDEPAAPRDASSALGAVGELVTPTARLDAALEALAGTGLPPSLRETLEAQLRESLTTRTQEAEQALDRASTLVALPWRQYGPERFDADYLARALDRTHGGLERVKARLVEVLAASRQCRGLLTVEPPRSGPGVPPALVVRPGSPRDPTPAPCLAGPSGSGRTSLALAVARALDRTLVRVRFDTGSAQRLVRGEETRPGRILAGLCKAGVSNPVFLLEAIDRVGEDDAGRLLDVLDPESRTAFLDACVQVPFDLSGVLWITTATDPRAVPDLVQKYLEVIELPGYGEPEKLAIAQRYLLARPFDELRHPPTPCLEPEPAAAARGSAPDTPAVLLDGTVPSVRELEALAAGPPAAGPPACHRSRRSERIFDTGRVPVRRRSVWVGEYLQQQQ